MAAIMLDSRKLVIYYKQKAGSTSVKVWVAENEGHVNVNDVKAHALHEGTDDISPLAIPEGHRIAVVCRNPYARFISGFRIAFKYQNINTYQYAHFLPPGTTDDTTLLGHVRKICGSRDRDLNCHMHRQTHGICEAFNRDPIIIHLERFSEEALGVLGTPPNERKWYESPRTNVEWDDDLLETPLRKLRVRYPAGLPSWQDIFHEDSPIASPVYKRFCRDFIAFGYAP